MTSSTGSCCCAVISFGVSGYRQGFIVGAMSFIGFLGGAIIGAKLAPSISSLIGNGRRSPVTGLVVVFLGAALGQLIASAAAAWLRTRILWRPAQTVDSVGGAVVSGISVLLVAWLMATAVNRSPYLSLRRQVHGSAIIQAVDSLVPDSARQLFANFLRLVEQQGFPQVFAGLGGDTIVPTRPPDPALARSPVVTLVRPSILKVSGDAPSCQKAIEGSGFVFSPQHVMTNAHVVAGVPHPSVDVGGTQLAATTVLFDPKRDIAVLYVPGLQARALDLRDEERLRGRLGDRDRLSRKRPIHGGFRTNPRPSHGPRRRHLLPIRGGPRDLRHPVKSASGQLRRPAAHAYRAGLRRGFRCGYG